MGKQKRNARKEERARKKEEQRLFKEAQERAAKRQRIISAVIPLIVGAGAVAAWSMDQRQVAGVVLLIGGIVWLTVALGFIGGAVKPKDSLGAGAIDYGNKK